MLALHGIPKKIIALLTDMYTDNVATKQRTYKTGKRGNIQGDPLLPILFNLLFEPPNLRISIKI